MIDFETYLSKIGEIGFVEKVLYSLIYVQGLPGAKLEEIVVFESGEIGQVLSLAPSAVEIVSLSSNMPRVGGRVARTDTFLEIPVGDNLLGNMIDPLGRTLVPSRPLPEAPERRAIEIAASGIESRARIKRACEIGVSIVDLMIPLGKGQRELVIGDQKTGKTRFLLRSLLSQVREGSVGIYAAIGKSQMVIKQVEQSLQNMGILDKTLIVAAGIHAPPGLIYLTPYAAMTIAEYFVQQGRDVILILDDLSMHAKAYREISLLGKRFPGRNSYPGDIFYTHARLLERAGNFQTSKGEFAITCLTAVEAPYGDVTGYIQTNAMSMTDGHLFFDHNLFAEGRRPAIDPFLSVTRVGRQTQSHLKQQIGRTLMAFFRRVQKMHNFANFGAELNDRAKEELQKETRLMEFFDETPYDTVPPNIQILLFGLLWSDQWKSKSQQGVRLGVQKAISLYETKQEVRKQIDYFVAGCHNLDILLERVKDFDITAKQ